MDMKRIRTSDILWVSDGITGTARVELLATEKASYVSVKRLSGYRPPAGALVRIIDAALDGPVWRQLYQTDPEGRVLYNMHYDGRITVKYRGVRPSLRVDRVGGVADFSIPIQAVAAMLGPAGLGIVDDDGRPRFEGEVSVA